MKTRTVTAESVLAAAVRLTEEQGLLNLSIPALASELELKPASLYNHIKGIDQLKVQVVQYALDEMDKATREAAIGYAREEALLRIAYALRDFATARPELYNAINLCAAISYQDYREMLNRHMNVAHQILDTYSLDDTARKHFIRAFRSSLHGFVSLEAIGAFHGNADVEESFQKMALHLIKMLEEINHGQDE